jgi:thiamine biosynthesis lipoprotein
MTADPFIFKRLSAGTSVFYTWFDAMHTRIDLFFCHLTEAKAKCLAGQIRQEVQRIERLLNRFDPLSEIAVVNREAGKAKVVVTGEFLNIIRLCADYNRQTQGFFDITVQSFNRYREGMRGIISDETASTLSFAHPDIQLDLCGFGKGYALDRCRTMVENSGCRDALLNFGNSSILALGNHPYGEGWLVEAADGFDNNNHPSIILHNECLTTSGNKPNGNEHIISPISGNYVKKHETISVKTPTGVSGEALSTALFAAMETFSVDTADSRSLLEQLHFHSFVRSASIAGRTF